MRRRSPGRGAPAGRRSSVRRAGRGRAAQSLQVAAPGRGSPGGEAPVGDVLGDRPPVPAARHRAVAARVRAATQRCVGLRGEPVDRARPARAAVAAASAGRRVARWRARSARSQVEDSSLDPAQRLGRSVLVGRSSRRPAVGAIAVERAASVEVEARPPGPGRPSRRAASAASMPWPLAGREATRGSAFEAGDGAGVGVGAVVLVAPPAGSARPAWPRPGRTAARTASRTGSGMQVRSAWPVRRSVPRRRRGGR